MTYKPISTMPLLATSKASSHNITQDLHLSSSLVSSFLVHIQYFARNSPLFLNSLPQTMGLIQQDMVVIAVGLVGLVGLLGDVFGVSH